MCDAPKSLEVVQSVSREVKFFKQSQMSYFVETLIIFIAASRIPKKINLVIRAFQTAKIDDIYWYF